MNKIIHGDCIEEMKKLENNSVDLVVTSPPYNVGIDYDSWDDSKEFKEHKLFIYKWLNEVFKVLKEDGRIALNIPYEINIKENGGRIFLVAEYLKIMR